MTRAVHWLTLALTLLAASAGAKPPAELPSAAQTAPATEALTQADVDEASHLLDVFLTGAGDFALAETQARTFYNLVLRDFGAGSRQALQIEWLIVLAVALQGRADEAQSLAYQMMEKSQRLLMTDDPLAYKCAAAFAVALQASGHGDEALGFLSEALAVAEQSLPKDALEVDELRLLQVQFAAKEDELDLAQAGYQILYDRLAARSEPEAMALRSLAMVGWAQFVAERRDPALAIPLFQEALAAIDAQFGTLKYPRMQPVRLTTVEHLAEAMETSGHGAEVPDLLRPLMAEVVALYGADSPFWADLAFLLAVALAGDEAGGVGEDEAIALLGRVVAIRAEVLEPRSYDLLRARINYAMLLAANGRAGEGVAQLRAMDGAALPGTRLQVVYVLRSAQTAGQLTAEQAVEAALVWLQDSQNSGAAAAQQLLTERLLSGSDANAALLRRRSDIDTELGRLRSELGALTSMPLQDRDQAEVDALRQAISLQNDAQASIRAEMAAKAPELANATGPTALSLAEIRSRLGPDDALVLIDSPQEARDAGLIVAVSDDAVEWHTFQVDGAEVEAAIATLRAAIDLRLGVRSATPLVAETAPAQEFDLATAHWLYAQLVGQVAAVTTGKAHLYFDLRGAISALPPQMMVETAPLSNDPARADWLIRHHAVTILPAISALPLHRVQVATGAGFLAFADARFDSMAPDVPTALRGSLGPLPETAGEVRAVAAALGQGESTLRLGYAATEAAVKSLPLDGIGTLYFATHGLVSGDQVGAGALPEAALALTPGDGEDGFLTASEIIGLRLNARIVVLSACNTASGQRPGAEALSGLAQAFLYAGARGLLVSHWPVESRSAVRLMTDTFRLWAEHPEAGAAEAQRRAILAMIDTPADPRWSHPAYWAPFVLVGAPD